MKRRTISLEGAVFRALRSDGPLSSSQIAVRNVLPEDEVSRALQALRVRGLVEIREEKEGREVVWGLISWHPRNPVKLAAAIAALLALIYAIHQKTGFLHLLN